MDESSRPKNKSPVGTLKENIERYKAQIYDNQTMSTLDQIRPVASPGEIERSTATMNTASAYNRHHIMNATSSEQTFNGS